VQPDNRLARAIELTSQTHAYTNTDQQTIRRKAEELRLILPLLPSESYIRGYAAMIYAFGLDQANVALEILAAGLMTDPLSANLYSTQGNVYRKMDRVEDARTAFLKAIELDPLDPNNYGRMSNLSAEAGDITGVFEWRLKNIEADPQDHEVAAQMARELYQWGLPEEGDLWLDRVRVLAPNSDILQRLLIDRAHSRDDAAEVIAVAQQMIAKPASMRHEAFPTAVFSYRSYMSRAGRYQEAYDFLVRVRPEITSFEQLPDDTQGILMQWASIELMSGFSNPEESKAAWEPFARNLRANGSWWFNEPYEQAIDFFFMGDLDAAIEKARADLAQPLSSWPITVDEWEDPIWAPITANPEIAARLSELKREKQQGREQIAAMLEEPEWNR
jgi:tetratricopeptide (TPR) repeat protein